MIGWVVVFRAKLQRPSPPPCIRPLYSSLYLGLPGEAAVVEGEHDPIIVDNKPTNNIKIYLQGVYKVIRD